MKNMKKTFDFGKIDWYGRGRRANAVTVDVELGDSGKGPEFSACANVWNARRTDIVAGGQILDELGKFLGGNGLFRKIRRLHRLYHCNYMHAGTPEQEAYLKEHRTWPCDYKMDCMCLEMAGLLTVRIKGRRKPYKYGSEWLYWPIPEQDLAEIKGLLGA